MEDEKFQQIVYVKHKLEEFNNLLDVLNSVYDKVIISNPICYVQWIKIATVPSLSLFSLLESDWVGTLQLIETSLSS